MRGFIFAGGICLALVGPVQSEEHCPVCPVAEENHVKGRSNNARLFPVSTTPLVVEVCYGEAIGEAWVSRCATVPLGSFRVCLESENALDCNVGTEAAHKR